MSSTEEGLNAEQSAEPQAQEAGDSNAAAPEGDMESLKAECERLREEANQNHDKWLRAQAELENIRRRATRDVENAHKYGVERFAAEMLNVKDSLELGLSAASESKDIAKLSEGMELTLKQLGQVMEKFNIVEVDPTGKNFDPEHHQAMTMQESTEHAPNTVITVFQKGYLLNDRLLRPAMVVVAKAPAK